MKRLLGILIIMVLLISTLGNMASADSLTLLCRVDIGDPASEAGHDVISWGPIEPDAHPTPGSWGGFVTTGENARVIWGHEEGTRCAFVTLDRCINPGAARQIVLRHLDGIYFDYTWEDASFDVFIKDITGNWILMYHYTDQALWSTWVTTAINLDTDIYGNPLDIDEYANVEVQLCATGEMWLHHPSDFGQVAFDWIELWGEQATPPEECGECEGGVTTLTLQYNGTTPADIMVKAKKGDVILFNDTVIPGEMFTFNGADKHGKLGSEIIIFVDGEEYTRIHTSCSQPIGIGMVFGDFVIVAGESLKGGPLCPVPNIPGCGECEGGVTTLTLQYNGTTTADVMVKGKKGDVILFNDTVIPGEMFTFNGADKHGKLGSEIKIFVDGEEYTKIHTSCSQPIGIGMIFGDFEIIGGESLKGGTLCPVPNIPATGECEGGVTTLTLQYNGTTAADVMVKGKKKDAVLFDGTVSPGEMFTFNGADKHGKLGSEIKIFVDGEEYTRIHTSCSQPIGIGMVFGDFEIVGGESLKGGTLPSII